MIQLTRYIRKITSQFTMLDRFIIKLDLVIIGILFAKLRPVLATLDRWRYVTAIIIAEIYFARRIYHFKKILFKETQIYFQVWTNNKSMWQINKCEILENGVSSRN